MDTKIVKKTQEIDFTRSYPTVLSVGVTSGSDKVSSTPNASTTLYYLPCKTIVEYDNDSITTLNGFRFGFINKSTNTLWLLTMILYKFPNGTLRDIFSFSLSDDGYNGEEEGDHNQLAKFQISPSNKFSYVSPLIVSGTLEHYVNNEAADGTRLTEDILIGNIHNFEVLIYREELRNDPTNVITPPPQPREEPPKLGGRRTKRSKKSKRSKKQRRR